MYDDEGRYSPVEQDQTQTLESRAALYLARVMGWMCVGLLTTLVAALVCLAIPNLIYNLYSTNVIYFIFIAQLAVAVGFSSVLFRIGRALATTLFLLYAALTGITFSMLALMFETASIFYVFALTSLIFGGMALYGFTTKRDLTRIGSLALFGLLGIILAGLVNFLLRSPILDFAITCIGIVVFIALIAYDTQRIKDVYSGAIASGHDEHGPELSNYAIYGAFMLYLDFINLFLKLLRLLGRRRR